MSDFIASNGVVLDERGFVTRKKPWDGERVIHEARKEFYQHLRDKELGQTRKGNIVVRTLSDDEVLILDETTGDSAKWHRNQISRFPLVFGHDEAKRYFEAHPEPKPWHNAKPGEAWVLAAHDDADEYPYVTDSNGRFIDENFVTHKPEDFVSGRRIWPEGDSDG